MELVSHTKQALKVANWSLYSLCGFICAIFFSWIILAQWQFGYSALHSVMDIEAHIQKYGPQNRYKKDFAKTDREEQIRLFTAINDSIHDDGKGLEDIRYHRTNGKEIGLLLRKAEVLHLQDVARLINVFQYVALAALLTWAGLIALSRYTNIERPTVKQQSLSILASCLVATVVIVAIGPVKVFYWFHELIFPAEHEWFFYYQDSLMTTLMKAPDLFGAIAILIVLLGLVIFISLNSFVDEIILKIDTDK